MRLGVDLDGVVVSFAPYADTWLRTTFGYDEPAPLDRWDWFMHYPQGEHAFKAWWLACERKHLFLHMPAEQGSIPVLKTLRSQGHDLVFLTHRPAWAKLDTLGWLGNRGLGGSELHVVERPEHKASVECDLYVDDLPSTIEHYLAAGKAALLFVQSWNAGAVGLPLAYSWRHIAKVVADLQAGAA